MSDMSEVSEVFLVRIFTHSNTDQKNFEYERFPRSGKKEKILQLL